MSQCEKHHPLTVDTAILLTMRRSGKSVMSTTAQFNGPLPFNRQGLNDHYRRLDPETLGKLAAHAVVVRARKGQAMNLAIEGSETVYFVRSGIGLISTSANEQAGSIVNILYPGDYLRSAFAPPVPQCLLVAAGAGEFLRLPYTTLRTLCNHNPGLQERLTDQTAAMFSRMSLHIAELATLTSPRRVAAFQYDLLHRYGVINGDTGQTEVPLTREQIASYLALNADTLSRIVSRLKSDGIITTIGRHRLVVHSVSALREAILSKDEY